MERLRALPDPGRAVPSIGGLYPDFTHAVIFEANPTFGNLIGRIEHRAEALPFDSFESLLKARAQDLFASHSGMLFGDEFERRHEDALASGREPTRDRRP